MNETANGVREQLVQWFARDIAHTGKSPSEVADAILARFEVTEKPVVTDLELGVMVVNASRQRTLISAGGVMRNELERAGLMFVRAEDGHR